MSVVTLSPKRWSVRARTAFAAATIVVVCLGLASGLLLLVLYRSLASSAVSAADVRADQVAAEVSEGRDVDTALLATDAEIGAVQIVDGGNVVAASYGAPDTPLVRASVPDGTTHDLGRVETRDFDLWVIARGVTSGDQSMTVLVGADREPIESTVIRIGTILAIGAPLVASLAVVGTYRTVGAALRPVEEVRARVAAITASDLSQRIPVSAGGDEISTLAKTMNDMLARLDAARSAQQRFIADASHELRSPLATLTAALELAHERPDLIDAAMVDESLLPEARRMHRLIEDLLYLARSDEDAGAPHVERDVDVDDLLVAETARLRTSAAVQVHARGIAPARTVGDPAALARVVRNLVDNAAAHASTTVYLRCGQEADGSVVIDIADDGPGIPEADRAKVFERFVRLDPTRARNSGGTGLGLAIVREILRQHGGTVSIGERPAGGAAFTVVLPRTGGV